MIMFPAMKLNLGRHKFKVMARCKALWHVDW